MLQYNTPWVSPQTCAMQQAARHATALAIPQGGEPEPVGPGPSRPPVTLASVQRSPPRPDRAGRRLWAASLAIALMAHAAVLYAMTRERDESLAGGGGQLIDAISVTMVSS